MGGAEEAAAPGAGREEGEEWVQQAGWSGLGRDRRQVLEDDQEDAPVVARLEHAGKVG